MSAFVKADISKIIRIYAPLITLGDFLRVIEQATDIFEAVEKHTPYPCCNQGTCKPLVWFRATGDAATFIARRILKGDQS